MRDNMLNRYLAWSAAERHRRFDAAAAVSLQTQSDQTVHMHKVVIDRIPIEVRLTLLLRGAGREGAGHRRAFRRPASRPP